MIKNVKIPKKAVHTNFKGKRRSNISISRVIPLAKIGGFLPLITAFTTLGGLHTGGSAILKALNNIKNGKEQLAEANRHNRKLELIAMGEGIFLKPFKTRYDFYCSQAAKKF